MGQLTSKTSSQHFLLRILKVIIQLRDAARSAGKKRNFMSGLCPLAVCLGISVVEDVMLALEIQF
jgi:hypothetical protein